MTKVEYPDSAGADDTVTFAYALDGLITQRTLQKTAGDVAATVIGYAYDGQCRRLQKETADALAEDGNGLLVDGTVRAFTYAYDTLGRKVLLTSHSDADPDMANFSDAVNQIQYAYDDLGRLLKEYQAHTGAVAAETTLAVEYAYAAPSGGVYTKDLRLTSVQYPGTGSGRVLTYDYGTTGGLNDTISRLAFLKDGETVLGSYQYNGAGRMVREGVGPVALDSYGGTAGVYAGFDRFGRVVRHPPTMEEGGLRALLGKSQDQQVESTWKGPYLREIPLDPWGHRLDYSPLPSSSSGAAYRLRSSGPDGISGTPDDISLESSEQVPAAEVKGFQ